MRIKKGRLVINIAVDFEYPLERLGVEELKKLQNANKGYIEYKIKQFLSSKEYIKKIDIGDWLNDVWECKEGCYDKKKGKNENGTVL